MSYILKNLLSDKKYGDELKKELVNNRVHYKEDQENGLVLFFNKFGDNFETPLSLECRSVVVDMNKSEIVSYSCHTPLLNQKGIDYIMRNSDSDFEIFQCYEGTLLSVFNHNNEWFISTRRCLDARKSIWKNDISHFDLFSQVLGKSGLTFETLCNKLKPELTYHFILLHHLNKNIVDYTDEFGDEYMKLVVPFVRNKSTQQVVGQDEYNDLLDENIVGPKTSTLEWLDGYNKETKWNNPPKSEGLIIRTYNKMGREILIKLQTGEYQFTSSTGPEHNSYIGLVRMYQIDKLKDFLTKDENKEKFEKITNPLNPTESFYSMGVIDSVFKVMTSELDNLYKMLYNNDGTAKKTDLYKFLPTEYKTIMFKLRGINFKNHKLSKTFGLKNIYYFLKSCDVDLIEKYLRMRKLLLNLVYKLGKDSKHSLMDIKKLDDGVDKINIKMLMVFTNKLFPEIVSSDYPEYLGSVLDESSPSDV